MNEPGTLLIREYQVHISTSNIGPVVGIVAIILIAISVLGVIARITTKLLLIRRLHLDDGMILFAFLLSCGQNAAIFVAISNGLGQGTKLLEQRKLGNINKALYASNLFYIPTLLLTKLAATSFIRLFAPISVHLRFSLVFAGILCAWALGEQLSAVFECRLPMPWSGTCFNLPVFWKVFYALSIISETVLIIWPCFIVWKLRTSWRRKRLVMACFLVRITVIAATAVQLALVNKAYEAPNQTYNICALTICTQLTQTLSITIAGVPYLKPFIDSMESGFLRTDDLRRRGTKGLNGYGTAETGDTKGSSKSDRKTIDPNSASIALKRLGNPSEAEQDNVTTIQAGRRDWDGESQTSRSNMIKKTTNWSIDIAPRNTVLRP